MDAAKILHGLIFYVLAAIALGSGLVVARARNLVYSAMGLLFSLLGVAGLFVYAHADFVAGIQIVVYVGGILVLILFGIMLTRRIGEVKVPNEVTGSLFAKTIPVVLTGLLLVVVLGVDWQSRFSKQGRNPNLFAEHESGYPEKTAEKYREKQAETKDGSETGQASDQEKSNGEEGGDSFGTVDYIGRSMMGKYLLAFEEISMLLLVALLGAAYLARRRKPKELEEAREAAKELEEKS